MLAFGQTREQHQLPVREFQGIVMGCSVVHIDLPEAGEPTSDFFGWQDAQCPLTHDILVKRNSVPGSTQTATSGSPTAANPRVTELLNFVVTSLSSILAGRLATWCRL